MRAAFVRYSTKQTGNLCNLIANSQTTKLSSKALIQHRKIREIKQHNEYIIWLRWLVIFKRKRLVALLQFFLFTTDLVKPNIKIINHSYQSDIMREARLQSLAENLLSFWLLNLVRRSGWRFVSCDGHANLFGICLLGFFRY